MSIDIENSKKIFGFDEEDDDFTLDKLKTKYRELALTYHPDKNKGSKDAEDIFKDITSAYSQLVSYCNENADGEMDLFMQKIINDDVELDVVNEFREYYKDFFDDADFVEKIEEFPSIPTITELNSDDEDLLAPDDEDSASDAEENTEPEPVDSESDDEEEEVLSNKPAPLEAHKRCPIYISFDEAYNGTVKEITIKTKRLGRSVKKKYRIPSWVKRKIFAGEGDLINPSMAAGDLCFDVHIEDLPERTKLDGSDIILSYPVSLYEYIFIEKFDVNFMSNIYTIDRKLDINNSKKKVVKINPKKSKTVIEEAGMLKEDGITRGDLIIQLEIYLQSSTLYEVHDELEEYFPPLDRRH